MSTPGMGSPGMSTPDMTQLERDLSEVLSARARSVPVTFDPYGRTARAIAADRRRRSILIAATVAAVTALTIVPVVVIGTLERTAGSTARPASTGGPVRLPDRDIVDWPLGGDLASNTAVVRQARTDLELAARADPAADGIQLLAVGSQGGGPFVVGLAHSTPVSTAYDTERVTVFIAGPGVAAPSAVATFQPDEIAELQVLAHTATGAGNGDYLLVAARPGIDRVEVSTGRRFGPDGVAARDYQPVVLRNGVAVSPLPERPTDPIMRVRGYRGAELAYDGFVSVARISAGGQLERGSLVRLAKEAGSDAGAVGAVLRAFAIRYGLDLSGASARVVWRHAVDGPDETTSLIEVRLPSGGTFQLVVQFAGRRAGQAFLRQVRFVPAGAAATWPIAWTGGDPAGCALVVAVPRSSAGRVDVSYVAPNETIPSSGHAGDAVAIDRCRRAPEPGQPGLLRVSDAGTGAELLRWDMRLPSWVYERTDIPSAYLGGAQG